MNLEIIIFQAPKMQQQSPIIQKHASTGESQLPIVNACESERLSVSVCL